MAKGARIPLQHAERFILGGAARFLFTNTETSNTRWFLVKEKDEETSYVYSTKPYLYIGKIKFREFLSAKTNPSQTELISLITIFEYVWKRITDLTLKDTIHVMHLGQCGVCGRPLTDPESILRGIGPVCLSKLQKRRSHGKETQ
jgi:hypothetical protein